MLLHNPLVFWRLMRHILWQHLCLLILWKYLKFSQTASPEPTEQPQDKKWAQRCNEDVILLFLLFRPLFFLSSLCVTIACLYLCLLFYHCSLCVITGAQPSNLLLQRERNKNLLIVGLSVAQQPQQRMKDLLINDKEYKRALWFLQISKQDVGSE